MVGALERPATRRSARDAGEVAGVGRLGVPITGRRRRRHRARPRPRRVLRPEATLEHLCVAAARRPRGDRHHGVQRRAARRDRRLAGGRRHRALAQHVGAVTVAFRVLALMARALGDDYDVEITEIHHRFKKDAPSGTAANMAEVVAEALGRDLGTVGVYGRHGLVGERAAREIGVLALRSGDVVGEHTVVFGTLGERLELTHRAHSRDTFARGPCGPPGSSRPRPGLYSMHDVLGSERGRPR